MLAPTNRAATAACWLRAGFVPRDHAEPRGVLRLAARLLVWISEGAYIPLSRSRRLGLSPVPFGGASARIYSQELVGFRKIALPRLRVPARA